MRSGTTGATHMQTLAAACLALLVGGCAAPKIPEVKEDPAAARLRQVLATTDALSPSTRSASAAEVAAQPEQKVKALAVESMSLSFVGNAPELLRPLAAARGLGLKVLGPQPHLPLFVVVDMKNVTFEEVLRDVAAQFGQRANLALTDSSIEIRYRSVQ